VADVRFVKNMTRLLVGLDENHEFTEP